MTYFYQIINVSIYQSHKR